MQHRFFVQLGAALFICTTVHADDSLVSQAFNAEGIQRVILRSAHASRAKAVTANTMQITVAGRAEGGAQGYHSPDPNWKETPASQWGMKFVAKRFGSVLVVSSENEIGYIHHQYAIDAVTVTLPKGARLVRETRALTGSGDPDLRDPR
jgi:hypothetical protein